LSIPQKGENGVKKRSIFNSQFTKQKFVVRKSEFEKMDVTDLQKLVT